ncbi:MAG: ROK family protein [Bacteroidota bacterium]|nr:ROK family protein [Bacteroidota bacterium]MDP4230670.1 ROK family protein [Bacteroidota bacterium]MDP4235360.1 ROK family protein [Bacteroidota bacterium]
MTEATPDTRSPKPDLAIGVDIGGTSTKLGVVDLSKGKILRETSFTTPNSTALDMAALLARHINVLIHQYPDITSIGIGVPGAMNADRTLVQNPPNFPKWEVEPLTEYVKAAVPISELVVMDNDAKVAALAEQRFGAAKNEQFFLLATLGTGVGGAIIADGKIFRGAFGGAGEFGHIMIDYNGPESNSGIRGCLEAYLGQKYLSAQTVEKLKASKKASSLRSFLPAGNLEPKDIYGAAQNGDDFAKEVLAEAGMILGIGFASVATLLDIRLFLVTGGVAQAGDLLLAPAREALRKNVLAHQRDSVEIRPAKFVTSAGMIGAALLTEAHAAEQPEVVF